MRYKEESEVRKIIGILSIVVGVIFLAQAFIFWGSAYSESQMLLKWMVGGFGWLFIIQGALAFPKQSSKENDIRRIREIVLAILESMNADSDEDDDQ